MRGFKGRQKRRNMTDEDMFFFLKWMRNGRNKSVKIRKMKKIMNKHLIILGIAVLLLTVGFSGCNEIEEKPTGKLVTASLSTLALTVDDLPQDYIKWSEDRNKSRGTIQDIAPVEVYEVVLVFENPENNPGYPGLSLFLSKYNSSVEANIFLYNQFEQIIKGYDNLNHITPEDVEQIGDESIYELLQGPYGEYDGAQSITVSLGGFRINNVVVFLSLLGIPDWKIDYTRLTIDYSKIVESRINASLH
ncbi:MAG: hypothetical protein JSW60_03115 [Thermoplasmatales archaeon]|nr:MAG: hypothetical protein JSW60_03115 [Thermoplasmatales archaeon]